MGCTASMKISWPHGHKFAFTMIDDTDGATVEKVKPVYDLLASLGMRITKSVWIFDGEGPHTIHGCSCEQKEYLKWVLSLQAQDFEIGLHNAAPTTSPRRRTYLALDRFCGLFGDRKIIHCNHSRCLENIYWGDMRLSSWRRTLYNLITRLSGRDRRVFRGHIEGDPLFWGDLCQERVNYVRNFIFNDLNTLAICPEMPYHDPAKPFVNFWFASAEGSTLTSFLKNFTTQNLGRLVEEGGLCIAYIHAAAGFAHHGEVNAEFRKRLEYIASEDGWFAPVSEVLDYLRNGANCASRTISTVRLRQLEIRWLTSKILHGTDAG
jgi:hypothetical protein